MGLSLCLDSNVKLRYLPLQEIRLERAASNERSYELLSTLLASPLMSPIIVPYISAYITPLKEFGLQLNSRSQS